MERDNTLNEALSEGPVPKKCTVLRAYSPLFSSTNEHMVLFRSDYLEVLRELFAFMRLDTARIPQKLECINRFKNPFWGVSLQVDLNRSGFILTGQAGTGNKQLPSLHVYVLSITYRKINVPRHPPHPASPCQTPDHLPSSQQRNYSV